MGVEFSELATVAATMFPRRVLTEASGDHGKFLKFAKDLKRQANTASKVVFVDAGAKRQYMDAFDLGDNKVLADVAVAISAALAIKDWLKNEENEPKDVPKKGFMTGNRWPREVEKFRINAFGMADYNSSDIIFSTGKSAGGEYYYGVSLKKKPPVKSADPTLINKAFDSILEGREFNDVKKEMKEVTDSWFADTLMRADKQGLIRIEKSHRGLPAGKLIRSKPSGTDKKYANIKGTLDEGYNKGNGFRTWMNKQVSDLGRGGLYPKLLKAIEPYMEIYANALINLILKVKLNDELNANKDLNKYYFGFALATGVGKYSEKTGPSVGRGSCYRQDSVLCALSTITSSKKKYDMKLVPNPAGPQSDAAKVFFEISKGKVKILDLELRYKGDFTSQPQFQARLTNDFKKIIKGECIMP